MNKEKSEVETADSQVLSEAGKIAKDSFNPCLGERERYTHDIGVTQQDTVKNLSCNYLA